MKILTIYICVVILLFYTTNSFSKVTVTFGDYREKNSFIQDQIDSLPTYRNTLHELPFVILVCSRNNELWVEKNLHSIFNQNYKNFRVIYIDDASQDSTVKIVKKYVQNHNLQKKITLVTNTIRQRKLYNIYNAFHTCLDNEIIVQVDGDDWLAHDNVLAKLNAIFKNPDVWLSYGQFKRYPEDKVGLCREIPKNVTLSAECRRFPWVTSHVKAFYGWLIKSVHLKDLLAKNVKGWQGRFYPAANDCATIFPMLDMAGEKIHFNPEVFYIYNTANPICGITVERNIQSESECEIRNLPTYQPISTPVFNRLEQFNNAIVDVVIASKNNDCIKTIEILASLKNNLIGLGNILIMYNSQDTATQEQFNNIQEKNNAICVNLAKKPDNYFNHLIHDHVIITNDTFVLEKPLAIVDCIKDLEKTFAYGIYFCYSQNMFDTHYIMYQTITDNLCAWQFLHTTALLPIHNNNFTLYRKENMTPCILEKMLDSQMNATVELSNIDKDAIGLFYKEPIIAHA